MLDLVWSIGKANGLAISDTEKCRNVGATGRASGGASGGAIGGDFQSRNGTFIIWSITGRAISTFSNYLDDEDEVLFMPFTELLILSVSVDDSSMSHPKYTFHCREINLATVRTSEFINSKFENVNGIF